jgi:hypothetical protein
MDLSKLSSNCVSVSAISTGRVTSVSTFSVISLKSIMLTANVLREKFKQNLKMLKRIIPLSQEAFICVTVS